MSPTETPTDEPHRDIVELLPWYANASLASDERERVRRHLAECPACDRELGEEQKLATAVAAPTPLPALDTAAGLAALESQLGPRVEASVTERLARAWHSLNTAPPAWRLAAALPTLAALVLAVFLVAPWERSDPTAQGEAVAYTLLTDPVATVATRLWVEIDPGATEGALRALLRALGAQIVAGPTAQGVYTLKVTGDAEEAATRLRASGLMRSAIPIDGP